MDPEWRAVAIHLKRAVRATLRRPHTSSVTALFVVIIGILTFVSPAVGGVVVDGAAAAALTALITLIFLG